MMFGNNAAAAGPPYQPQMLPQVAQPMQGFTPQQQQQQPQVMMASQNPLQGSYRQGDGQFGQQQGIIQPVQSQFGQQPQQ